MKRKIVMFSMLLAAMLLTSNLYAQEKQGGLFGKDWFSGLFSSDDANVEELEAEEYQGLFAGNNRDNIQWSDGIGNQGFNQNPQETPLGSGVLMLVAAGAGYALLKRKEEKN